MATTKQTKPEQTVTHDQFVGDLNPQILKAIEAMEKLKSTNEIRRAFKVKSKEMKKGNAKLDEHKEPIFGEDGKPQMWPDRYLISTTSEDGKIDVKVTEEQWNAIEVGKWYMAVGHIEIYTPYEGMPKEIIKYDDFQQLYGVQA